MNDDQYFLANAYFDGELTGDDVRIAEADPDVMSEVDRLRSVRFMLLDSRPSASARSAAIDAAMAEFAPLVGAVGAVTSISRKQPAYRRSTSRRYLGVAAAVATIGAVGVVVAGLIGSGSDNDEASTDLAIKSETIAMAESDDSRSASATSLATAMEMEASDQILAESAPASGPVADDAASDTSVAGDEMNDGTAMTMVAPLSYPPTGGPIEPIADRDQTISSPGQLAGLGVLLTNLRDAGTLGATPETRCAFEDPAIEIVDSTRYRFPDATTTVLVALVASGIEGHTLALDPETCDIVVVGP